jgi:hypothetical protein
MPAEATDPSAASYHINNLRLATHPPQLAPPGVNAIRSGFRPAEAESRFGPGDLNKVQSLRQRA